MSSTKRTSFIGSISVTPAASPEAVEKLYRAKRGGSVKEEILSEDSPYKEQLEFIKLNNGSFGSVFSSQISMRRDPFSRALLSFMHWKEDFFNPKFEYLYQNLGENVRVVNGGLFLVSSVFIITTLLVLVYVTNVQVSGIWLYNLFQVVILSSTASGILISRMFIRNIITATIASKLLYGNSTFVEICQDARSWDVDQGRMFRRIIVTLFLAFEASLLWLCITLDWNLIDEHLGDISCILPNYSRNISIAPSQNLGRYLAGDSEFALLYNYGLPLPDGVVGGWAAWPLEAPSSSFQISSSKGILYAIYTYCDDPEMSSTKLDGTRLTYRDPVNWHGAYSAFVDIIYPAGSHSIDNWNSSDISQSCEIKLFSASASVKFSFIVDEWLMVTGGQIQSITAGNLTAYQSMAKSHRLYYDDFETGIERKDRVQWSNMTQWIAGGFENVFDGYIYHPSQGSAFVNLMQWATLPDGLYHPENTWKGVSAAIAAIAHYVTLQYENESNDIGTCESYGYANSGMIIASEAAIATCMYLGIAILTAKLLYMINWLLTCSSGWNANKAHRCLWYPLRLIFDMRRFHQDVLSDASHRVVEGMSSYDFASVFKAAGVRVMYGEAKSHREVGFGSLALGTRENVIRIKEGREYI